MAVIALVRHGSTDWNKEGRMQGQLDIPLNQEGRAQAKALAMRLRSEEWDMIFASDLQRASETAAIIGDYLHIPVIRDARLREIYFGKIEGTTEAERIQQWGEKWYDMDLGKESEEVAGLRGASFVHEVAEKYPDRRVLVVSHGALLKATLGEILQEDINALDNTSVTMVVNTEGNWLCTLFNCTRHLDLFPTTTEKEWPCI